MTAVGVSGHVRLQLPERCVVAIAGYANHATTSPIRTNLRGPTVVSPPSASRAGTARHVCALGVAVLFKLEVRAQGVLVPPDDDAGAVAVAVRIVIGACQVDEPVMRQCQDGQEHGSRLVRQVRRRDHAPA